MSCHLNCLDTSEVRHEPLRQHAWSLSHTVGDSSAPRHLLLYVFRRMHHHKSFPYLLSLLQPREGAESSIPCGRHTGILTSHHRQLAKTCKHSTLICMLPKCFKCCCALQAQKAAFDEEDRIARDASPAESKRREERQVSNISCFLDDMAHCEFAEHFLLREPRCLHKRATCPSHLSFLFVLLLR